MMQLPALYRLRLPYRRGPCLAAIWSIVDAVTAMLRRRSACAGYIRRPTSSVHRLLMAPSSGMTATVKWKYATGSFVSSSPAIDGSTVYIGSWDKRLYALTAPTSGLTASVVFSYTTGDFVVASPAIDAGGTIYVGSY